MSIIYYLYDQSTHQRYQYYINHQTDTTLTLQPPNFSIWIFTHLEFCLADAIHNFKWVKIIQIWQNEGQLFSNLADLMLHFIFNMFKLCYSMW